MSKYSHTIRDLRNTDKLLQVIERELGHDYFIPWRVIMIGNIVSCFVFEHDRFYKKVLRNHLFSFEYNELTDDKYLLVEKESII